MSGARPQNTAVLRVGPHAPVATVRVVRDIDDLMRVFAIRSVVYMGEQACPFDEEYDGNDLCGATHFLAEIGGEPVGTLRLRWFADFVKFERAAVKTSHRGLGVTPCLWAAGIECARRKGFRRALAHVRVSLAPFWAQFGFAPKTDAAPFSFSDFDYVEVQADLEPHPEALSLMTPPMVLLRPEGDWDHPGVLERVGAGMAA